MSIRFYCPKCGALIAFEDRHQGKRAKCLTCGQRMVIPGQDDERPRTVAPPEAPPKAEPLPGFYRAAWAQGWRAFFRVSSIPGLVFVSAAVAFKFFIGHVDYSFEMGAFRAQLPVGLIITLGAWGGLFWYYLEVINAADLDVEGLPELDVDGMTDLLGQIVRSLWAFVMAFVLTQLPSMVLMPLVGSHSWTVWVLSNLGLFLLPIALILLGVQRATDAMFQARAYVRPVLGAFGPYISIVLALVAVCDLQMRTLSYESVSDQAPVRIGLHLFAQLGVQVLALVCMRSMGLFYKHYACWFDG